MAFPWTYKQKLEYTLSSDFLEIVKQQLSGKFKQKLVNQQCDDIEFAKDRLSFISYNSLFSIGSKVSIFWTFNGRLRLYWEFDMTNFIRLLSAVALLIGLLGSLTFKHYLVITFVLIISLYFLNFFIQSVYLKKMVDDVLSKTIPAFFEQNEAELNYRKFTDTESTSNQNHTKSSNFTIKYDYIEKDKENADE